MHPYYLDAPRKVVWFYVRKAFWQSKMSRGTGVKGRGCPRLPGPASGICLWTHPVSGSWPSGKSFVISRWGTLIDIKEILIILGFMAFGLVFGFVILCS